MENMKNNILETENKFEAKHFLKVTGMIGSAFCGISLLVLGMLFLIMNGFSWLLVATSFSLYAVLSGMAVFYGIRKLCFRKIEAYKL